MSLDPKLDALLSKLEPKPAAYLDAARQIEAMGEARLRPVRAGVLSTFTAESLRPYLIVEGARRGLRVQTYFGPWGQVEQQAMDPNSALYRGEPSVIVLALLLDDISRDLMGRFASLTEPERDERRARVLDRIDSLLAAVRTHSASPIAVFNFAPAAVVDAGFADAGLARSQAAMLQQLNDELAARCRSHASTFVFDLARVVTDFGAQQWRDARLWHTARIPFGAKAQLALAERFARFLRAIEHPPCKCLVVDLDNTLWGGVLGDDGERGIAVGEDYPGNVFKRFQERLLALRGQGILLAIASKNDDALAVRVLGDHPDMVLRPKDFAAMEIHWNDKAGSLRAIAKRLNIGLDALAFFDDNPVEREWVKKELPEVTVIDVPADPMGYIAALESSGAFDRVVLSADDFMRADMMSTADAREALRTSAGSVEEFLDGLAMEATVGELGAGTATRIVQLLGKTNQFNLTTRRHTQADLDRIVEGGGRVLWMRLADRFGDNGLIAIAVAAPISPERWMLDSFVMSCRVMGRRAETALLAELVGRLRALGARVLEGEYLPTERNGVVKDFLAEHGFARISQDHWSLDLAQTTLAIPNEIEMHVEPVEKLDG